MLSISKRLFSSGKSGSLFTWEKKSKLGLGSSRAFSKPTRLGEFKNNVNKVAMGYSHNAIITSDGGLFTYGEGKDGQLGHNDGGNNHATPKLVQFFTKNNLKVVDVALGQKHTVVLTHDGDVWTFGKGGKQVNPLFKIFVSSVSPLGHGDTKSHHSPTPVMELRRHPKITNVTAGQFFTTVLNKNGQLYNWGRGQYGVFGNGENDNLNLPKLNDHFEILKQEESLVVKEIHSAASYSMAIMQNGKLYGWGSNDSGQIGAESEIGVELYETCNFATEIAPETLKDRQVVELKISQNCVIFRLDNGQVYWSGMKLVSRPEKIELPADKPINLIGACRNGVAMVSGQHIFVKNDFAEAKEQDVKTGIKHTTVKDLLGADGQLIDIGGSTNHRFAILREI